VHGPWGVQYAPPCLFPLKLHPLGGLCMHSASVRALFSPHRRLCAAWALTRTNGLTEILVSKRGKHTLKTTLPGAHLSTNMVPAAVGARLAPDRRAGSPLWRAKHLQEARKP